MTSITKNKQTHKNEQFLSSFPRTFGGFYRIRYPLDAHPKVKSNIHFSYSVVWIFYSEHFSIISMWLCYCEICYRQTRRVSHGHLTSQKPRESSNFRHNQLGLVSISDKALFREISQSLEGARSGIKLFVLLRNLTGTSEAVLPICFSNSNQSDDFKYKCSGLKTLRDLIMRRLIGYWNMVQIKTTIVYIHCYHCF